MGAQRSCGAEGGLQYIRAHLDHKVVLMKEVKSNTNEAGNYFGFVSDAIGEATNCDDLFPHATLPFKNVTRHRTPTAFPHQ